MIRINAKELEEIRLAIAARARMNGSGTEPHKVCVSVLQKLDDAEHRNAESDAAVSRKIAGVDSTEYGDT